MASGVKILNHQGKISNALRIGQLKPRKIRNSQIRASRFGFEKEIIQTPSLNIRIKPTSDKL